MPDIRKEEFNVSWLNEDFIKSVFQHGTKLSDVKIEWAVAVGENQICNVYRLNDGSRSVIVKDRKDSDLFDKFTGELDMYNKEKEFYSGFMQLLKQVIGERISPDAYDCPNVLVLEDLRPLGYNARKRLDFNDITHAKYVISMLAKIHAGSQVLLSKKEVEQKYKVLLKDNYSYSPCVDHIMTDLAVGFAKAVALWPEVSHLGDRFLRYAKLSYKYTVEELRKPRAVTAFIHADPHNNNIMFHQTDPFGKPVLAIDYQFSMIGEPIWDIIYFTVTSCQDQVLTEHYDDLLKSYVEAYNSTLTSTKCKGPRITLNQLKQRIDSYPHLTMHLLGTRSGILMAKEGTDLLHHIENGTAHLIYVDNEFAKPRLVRALRKYSELGLF